MVILPLLKDPRRDLAINELKTGGIISELGLVELISYLSRNLNEDPLPYAIRLLTEFNISIKSINNVIDTPLGKLNELIYHALFIANEVRLKTLDLLHLAYVILFQVDEFVTADKEFKKASDFLSRRGIILKLIE
ncbi:hypothetical protein GFS03_04150 [Sulfolobus sp. E5-1-F]|nr:hypothetical protein GFS03_04150 [Sulfolobus sp. E5-1-F]QGA69661.1 hypothetical protein GFS33_09515 [Sulfolobus sp. E11-6]